MLPRPSQETLETERISGASRVGLWKVLVASMLMVIVGFALAAGVTS